MSNNKISISKAPFIILLILAFIVGGAFSAFIFMPRGEGDILSQVNQSKLEEIDREISSQYYQDYKKEDLIEGIYKGYVEGLGDPYSAYMTKKEFSDWKQVNSGEYGGIGVTFTTDKNGNYLVLSVTEDSPADKAGIKSGDYILKANGKTYDDSEILATHLRGEAGTDVDVTYVRKGKIKEVTITRAIIESKSVKYEMKGDDIGYIQIDSFIETTADDFADALESIEKKGAKGLVLDLRDNGGGLVDQSVEIADYFLDEGVVCYVEDKNGTTDTYTAHNGKTDLKTVVLVDGESASASEILAGAMKDNGYEIVGETTFGKGIIQATAKLGDGSALKLTILRYLSPDKHEIHEKGIKPTVKVFDDEDTEADEQLEKAIKLLEK